MGRREKAPGDAIALANGREQEFHEVSEDVGRKISALDLVTRLSKDLENQVPATKILGIELNRIGPCRRIPMALAGKPGKATP